MVEKIAGEQHRRLSSWKEIAAFFGRDQSTVKRWEESRQLPVYRVPGARSTVYAFTDELSAWLRKGGDQAAAPLAAVPPMPTTSPPWWKRRLAAAAFGATALILVLGAALYGPGRAPQAAQKLPADPHVAALYLQGLHDWNTRTPQGLNNALGEFTQVTMRAPDYAPAYVGLADCYNLLREYSTMQPEAAYARATAAAERAVELDDSLAGAHRALAFAMFNGAWDVAGARREFARALELDPNSALTHHWYSTFLLTIGEFPHALQEIDIARKLEPYSSAALADRALILYRLGRRDEAVRALRQLESAEPQFRSPHEYLDQIYFAERNAAGYIAELKQLSVLQRDKSAAAVADAGARALPSGGDRAFAAMLRAREALYRRGETTALELARNYAVNGEKQNALRYLQAAVANHESDAISLAVMPELSLLHADPGYLRLVSALKLHIVPQPHASVL